VDYEFAKENNRWFLVSERITPTEPATATTK
jgi:hypothetical protein